MTIEIEKYLEQNNLSYNRAIKNDVGEYVGIGDLINNYNSELKEQLTAKQNTIQNQGENIIKWMNDCHIKMAENQDLINKLASKDKEIKELKTTIEGLYEDKAGADI